MNLHSVTLSGLRPFPDPVSVNFDNLPPLIAIHGLNNAGKTTFLDGITAGLYLRGGYRAGSLIRLFTKQGQIRVVWSDPDRPEIRYTSLVMADPTIGRHGRMEATLHENDGPAIAGPLQADYLRAIEERLGSLDLWLCSAYSTQQSRSNAKTAWSFLTAKRSERRALMAELMGHDRYAIAEKFVKGVMTPLETDLEAGRSEIRTLQSQTGEVERLRARVEELTLAQHAAETDLSDAVDRRSAASDHQAKARTRVESFSGVQEARRTQDLLVSKLAKGVSDTKVRISNNQGLLARRDVILKACAATADLDSAIEQLDGQIETARNALTEATAKRHEAQTKAREREQQIANRLTDVCRAEDALRGAEAMERQRRDAAVAAAQSKLETAEGALARATDSTGILKTVPCGGVGEYADCQFLTQAGAAQKSIPDLEGDVADARARVEEAGLAESLGQIDLGAPRAAVQQAKRLYDEFLARPGVVVPNPPVDLAAAFSATRKKHVDTKATYAADVKLRPQLDAAEARVAELELSLGQQEEDLRAARQTRDEYDEMLKGLPEAEAGLALATTATDEAAEAVKVAQAGLSDLGQSKSETAGLLLAAERVLERIQETEGKLRPLVEDVEDWSLIRKFCSPTGGPALRVDLGLPDISAFATSLLREAYGSSLFSIKIRSQREGAEGQLLEDLDVELRNDGAVMDAEDLAGGDSILISEAIALAVTLYQATQRGRRLGTLMRDEIASMLDIERMPAFMRMMRRVIALGRFSHVLLVSHDQSSIRAADARLRVGGGLITVE